MNCGECERPATFLCQTCEETLCGPCDESLHRGGSRAMHMRATLCVCGAPSLNNCATCTEEVCFDCHHKHAGHILEPRVLPSRVGVYWDSIACAADFPALLTHVPELNQHSLFKVFGPCFDPPPNFQVEKVPKGTKPIFSIFVHVLVDCLTLKLTHVVLISAEANEVKANLMKLQANLPSVNFSVSASLHPLELAPLDLIPMNIPVDERPKQASPTSVYLEACNIFHSLPRVTTAMHDILLTTLVTLAKKGECVFEASSFIEDFCCKNNVDRRFFEEPETLQLVHVWDKNFGKSKTVQFIGLRVTQLSLESLVWVLHSMKRDEMLPLERVVLSRLKEAFGCKPSLIQWTNLLEAARGFSLHVPHNFPVKGFTLHDCLDPSTSAPTTIIYPKGEEWTEPTGNFRTDPAWQIFLSFFDEYFRNPDGSIDEEKAIPGGRYHCAQFLKLWGHPALQQLSLGKLSSFVQLAISDGLFGYNKTLLQWTGKLHQTVPTSAQLVALEQAVAEIIQEAHGPVQVAQLPLSLKKKLGNTVDYKALGFSKFKDLLVSLNGVEVISIGHNNLHVAFHEPINRSSVTSTMKELLGSQTVSGEILEQKLTTKLGRAVCWQNLNCASIYEFAERTEGITVSGAALSCQVNDISTEHSKSSSLDETATSCPAFASGVFDFELKQHKARRHPTQFSIGLLKPSH